MNTDECIKILNINKDDSDDDIHNKYFKLIKKYHPDINHTIDSDNEARKIIEAYKFYSENKEKIHYELFDYKFKPFSFQIKSERNLNGKFEIMLHLEICEGIADLEIINNVAYVKKIYFNVEKPKTSNIEIVRKITEEIQKALYI
jgi:DnaJ-class molecular chaperone